MKFIKQHYHWIILVIVFLQNVIYGGMGNSESVFVIPIVNSLGCTRGDYSLATITTAIVSAVTAAASSKLFRKFGYQKVTIVGLLVNSTALAVQAFSQNLGMIAFSKALYGLGGGILSTAGAVKVANSWFHKHNGLILGILTMATGLGGGVMNLLLGSLIDTLDWRIAKLAAAGMLASVTILFLAVRNEPGDMGLQPYGEGQKKARCIGGRPIAGRGLPTAPVWSTGA
jgi:MFS family permease